MWVWSGERRSGDAGKPNSGNNTKKPKDTVAIVLTLSSFILCLSSLARITSASLILRDRYCMGLPRPPGHCKGISQGNRGRSMGNTDYHWRRLNAQVAYGPHMPSFPRYEVHQRKMERSSVNLVRASALVLTDGLRDAQ